MYELKKNGKVFTSKSVGTGPSSYEKRIYRAAVSQRLRNTDLMVTTNSLNFKIINIKLFDCKFSISPSTASIRYPRPVVRF